jgi:hypothetical protein
MARSQDKTHNKIATPTLGIILIVYSAQPVRPQDTVLLQQEYEIQLIVWFHFSDTLKKGE